jgi:hypothetical protein
MDKPDEKDRGETLEARERYGTRWPDLADRSSRI